MSFVDRFARSYALKVAQKLNKFGLKYDDLLVERVDVLKAIQKRTPAEQINLRNLRMKRASDLSMKHVYLSKEAQKDLNPFDRYLKPLVEKEQVERLEREDWSARRLLK